MIGRRGDDLAALEDGTRQRMIAGHEYLLHINPFSPARKLFVSTPEGKYLGTAARVHVPCRTDAAAAKDRIKETKEEYARAMRSLDMRHINKRLKEAEAQANNARVIDEAAKNGLLKVVEEEKPGVEQMETADEAILELYGR